MRYGTLVNGSPVDAPNPLVAGGMMIHNPTDAQYEAAGYLPIIDTPAPEREEGDETYYAASWNEVDGQIVRVWTETEPPTPEPVAPTLEERLMTAESTIATLETDNLTALEAVAELYEMMMS